MTSKNEQDSVSKSLPLFTHNLSHASLRLYVTANSFLEGSHEGKDIYICVFFFYRSVKNLVKIFFPCKKYRPTKSFIIISFFSLSSHSRRRIITSISTWVHTETKLVVKLLPWFTPPIAFYQKWWAGAGWPNSTLRAPASFISRESFPFPICGARVSDGVGASGIVERVTPATRAAFPTRRRASPVAPPRGAARSSPTSGAGRMPLTRRPISPRPSRAGAEMHWFPALLLLLLLLFYYITFV